MKIKQLIEILERIAPPELAESFDSGKIGLSLDNRDDITKVAIALDPSEYAIRQTIFMKADMLITHHPLIFNPITAISRSFSRILEVAIENHISIYNMHTNYDKADNGINDALAKTLGLKNIKNLELGRTGRVNLMNACDFAKYVGDKLDTNVKIVGDTAICIENVMVIGGSCFRNEYIDLAQKLNVDAFISGDLTHHAIKYSEDIGTDICLIDATHYATEIPGMKVLANTINDVIDTVLIEEKPIERYILRS